MTHRLTMMMILPARLMTFLILSIILLGEVGLTSATFDRKLEDKATPATTTDPSLTRAHSDVFDPKSTKSKAMSCAYAIAMDEYRSCADECANVCGLTIGSHEYWASELRGSDIGECTSSALTCTVPVGLQMRLKPTVNYTDSHVLNNGTKRKYTVRKVLAYDPKELKKAVYDPWRLSYASIKKNARIYTLGSQQCHYISLMRPVPTGSTASFDWKARSQHITNADVYRGFVHDVGSGLHVGEYRKRPVAGEVYEKPIMPMLYDQTTLTYSYTPSITGFIQQWYLRYTSGPDNTLHPNAPPLALGFVSSYPLLEEMQLKKFVDYEHEASKDLTAYELETFTTLNWRAHSSPVLANRTTCLTCTIYVPGVWCDMSASKLTEAELWAGWHADSRSASLEGSSCGVPPLACLMQGGEPVLTPNECRPSELILS